MNRLIYIVALGLLLTGCAAKAATAPAAQPAGTSFRGEVWTWDERTNVVTLRIGTRETRVQITPDQIKQLRLHEVMTVRGELAPPAEIQQFITMPGPMRAVPEGASQQSDATGTVSASDPKGLVSLDTERGRITVWTATSDTSAFPPGTEARVQVTIQPVRFELVKSSDSGGAEPSASIATSEPGEHSIVTGRVIGVDPKGAITVESPRGPVTVLVPNAKAFALGAPVQIRTSLQRTQ